MGAAKPPASTFAPIDGGRVRGLGAGFKALQRLHAVAVGVCPPVQPRVQQHAEWEGHVRARIDCAVRALLFPPHGAGSVRGSPAAPDLAEETGLAQQPPLPFLRPSRPLGEVP